MSTPAAAVAPGRRRGPDLWAAASGIASVQTRLPKLERVSGRASVPLSAAQERLWSLFESERDTCYYNVPIGWWIEGEVDIGVLQRSLAAIVQRHESLQSVFQVVNGEPVASTLSARPECEIVEIPGDSLGERKAAALDEAFQRVRRPFDLSRGPLFRADLFALDPAHYLFVVCVHQIVFDGWSMRVLSHELAAHYGAFLQKTRPSPPELPIQYGDFACWQREWLRGDLLGSQVRYWRSKLAAPYNPLQLPAKDAAGSREAGDGLKCSWSFSADLTAALTRLGRQEGATTFAVLTAAFQALLQHYTGQQDIMVFASTAARNRPELQPLIGLFANVLPLRTDLSGKPTFRELLRRVNTVILEAFANQDVPFASIMQGLSCAWGNRAPLFQAMVIYQNAPLPRFEAGNAVFTPAEELDNGAAKFDLLLEIANSPAGVRGSLKYRIGAFEPGTIVALLRDFRSLLESAVRAPDRPVRELLHVRRQAPIASESAHTHATADFAAPRDPLEWQIAGIWQKAFCMPQIGIRDDFFELGGHSLLAVRVFSEIERCTGRVLPLVTLFQAPTIERLAAILRQEGWKEPWSSLVPLKPSGSRLPFYCVHGRDGNVVEFSALTRHCDAEQPFYGIQAQGLDGKSPRLPSVEEMAVHYVREIRSLQPHGPYALGGSSFGGMVAYEMAQQLTAQGEEVGALVLFDTHAPGYPRYLPRMTQFRQKLMWQRFRFELHWSNFVACAPADRLEYVLVKFGRLVRHEKEKLRKKYRKVKTRVERILLPRRIRDVQQSGAQANRTYVPRPYPGKVILFRAAQQPYGIYPDETNGWSGLALGGLEIHEIPGHHGSIVYAPRVRYLVQKLMEVLHGT